MTTAESSPPHVVLDDLRTIFGSRLEAFVLYAPDHAPRPSAAIVAALEFVDLTGVETTKGFAEQSSTLSRLLVVVENYARGAYNTSRRQFPANITDTIFRFADCPLFEAPDSAKEAPTIDFSRPQPGK